MTSTKELLEKARKSLQKKEKSKSQDPHLWKPPSIDKGGKAQSFKFVVLPPLEKGEKCFGGATNQTDMEYLPFYKGGTHWLNKRPLECPRVHDNEDCPLCQVGFDLLSETTDKKQRSKIGRKFLPNETYAFNIYFPPYPNAHPDVSDKVFYVKFGQRSIIDKFSECLNLDEAEAQGDTPEEKRAWGLYYLVERMYVFHLVVKEKNDYNNYDDSQFLVSTEGDLKGILSKIDKKLGTDKKVAEILAQRHDLGEKYEERDLEKLKSCLKSDGVNSGDDEDDSGFDETDEGQKEGSSSTSESGKTPEADEDKEKKKKADEKLKKARENAAKSESKDSEFKDAEEEEEEEDEELENLLEQLQSKDE